MEKNSNRYFVLASSTDIALPYLTQRVSVSLDYDKRLFSTLKAGDKFVFAKSYSRDYYGNLDEVILPGVKQRGVLCKINSISTDGVFVNVEYTGLNISLLTAFDLDVNKKLVCCDAVSVPTDESSDSSLKYDKLAYLENSYRKFRDKYNLLPPLPDFSDTFIDEVPFKVAAAIDCGINNKMAILEANSTVDRFNILVNEFSRFSQDNRIDYEIEKKVNDALEKNQREFILRQRAETVRKMLKEFDGEDAEDKYQKLIDEQSADFPEHILTAIKKELSRLKSVPSSSQEGNLIRTYLDLLTSLPYKKHSTDNSNMEEVIKVLNEDHYGLEKQKDRIIQYLAVKEMTNSLKAPIICLYGPPGVGKTSLAISIARALGRKFQKIALGGVHDESEIRGHRRTYLGALPGKIINAIKRAEVNNPVILLDEIDKVQDGGYHGDPASALLEVLDPEQNYRFEDNYLEQPFDLSQVLFICTANDISQIPAPLRDRLELIPLYTYTKVEKMHIAKEFLLALEYEANGVKPEMLTFEDSALDYVIEFYTREAGVRQLRRSIGTIIRKFAVKYLESGRKLDHMTVTIDVVKDFLGKEKVKHDKKVEDSQVGIVNGLAYTDAGGEVLNIEVNTFKGKGNLIRTGSLGDVMKEACEAALTYIKSNEDKFNIPENYFETHDIHIHFPDTSTPKDGPSAGIATTVVLLSAIAGIKIRNDVAMTGEVDLRGNAMQIGGLREKTLAAVREHIVKVLVPHDNHNDVLELPKEVTDNIEIVEVKTIDEVIPHVFIDYPYTDKLAKATKKTTTAKK